MLGPRADPTARRTPNVSIENAALVEGPDDLHQQMVRGLGWSGSMRVVQRILQFAFGIILARLLAPSDFGLIALVTVFIGFVSVFNDLGLGAAVVQRPR